MSLNESIAEETSLRIKKNYSSNNYQTKPSSQQQSSTTTNGKIQDKENVV